MNNADIIDVLQKAKDTISDPAHWCTQYSSVDVYGNDAFVSGKEAVAWCIYGAIHRVFTDEGWEYNTVKRAKAAMCDYTVDKYALVASTFNDNSTHQDVMKLFDDVIEELRNGLEVEYDD